ncbi:MAG: copper resistance protein CopD, partial [Nitrosopumilaceae archaeon]
EHTGLKITKFNLVLKTFERITVPDPNALPFGMVEDRFGNIWFAQHTIDKLGVYDPHNNNLIEIDVPTSQSFVQFMTSDNNNNIWFVEQQGNRLGVVQISEIPSLGVTAEQPKLFELKYAELVSPLISMGIIATSLFFVKAVNDKKRIDSLTS